MSLTDNKRSTSELLNALMSLSSNLEVSEVLERFVSACAQLTQAHYAAINVFDAQGESVVFIHHGIPGNVAEMLANSPHAVGVLGQIPDAGVLMLDDLTQHPAFLGMPPNHPKMGPFLGTAVRLDDKRFGYLYLSNPYGPTSRTFDNRDAEVVQALAAGAASAINNARSYALVRRREDWMRAGQEITTMLLQGAEEDEVLSAIAVAARNIAEADTAALVLPGMRGALIMEIVEGWHAQDVLGLEMPPGGMSHTTLNKGEGIVVDSLSRHRTLKHKQMRQFGPALYTPMITEGRPVGVLVLLRKVGSMPFSDTDLDTTQSFANQAALALVLAEARQAQDMAALFDERERIARDLHDLAIQQLFATGMQLSTVRRRAERGVALEELSSIIDEALDNVDSTVRQIRTIVHALKDPDATTVLSERLRREASLARTGLGFAPSMVLQLDADDVSESLAVQEEFDSRVAQDLSDDVVAVVREGLANAARHARASSVQVRVVVRGVGNTGTVSVEVLDDGVGVDRTSDRKSGTANLAARARAHRGTFSIGAAPTGRGTMLSWEGSLG